MTQPIYERLVEVIKVFEELKAKGFNEEILVVYIVDKTKLSKKQVRHMLSAMDDFYGQMLINKLSEGIEDDKNDNL